MSSAPAPPVERRRVDPRPDRPGLGDASGRPRHARWSPRSSSSDLAGRLAGGPRTATELADEAGVPELPLYRLLRSATGLGIFTELPDGRVRARPARCGREASTSPCPGCTSASRQFSRAIATGKTGMQLAHGAGSLRVPRATTRNDGCRVRQGDDAHPRGRASGRRRRVRLRGAPDRRRRRWRQRRPALRAPRSPPLAQGCALRPAVGRRARHTEARAPPRGAARSSAATSSTRCRPAATPTCCRTSSTTGPRTAALRILGNCRKAMGAGGRLLHRRDGGPGR